MTRPKVDPDKRQRTAQACDSCKRRKQKCNGLKPCTTCQKRSLSCTYGLADEGSDEHPSPKRRMVVTASAKFSPHHKKSDSPAATPIQHPTTWAPAVDGPQPAVNAASDVFQKGNDSHSLGAFINSVNEAHGNLDEEKLPVLEKPETLQSRASAASQGDEEAVVYSNTRMLQDPTGRLLYIGDSATLSFLQLIRMIVDNVAGPSAFTMDPRRHRIVENPVSLPYGFRRTHLLPDRETADVLVNSYFTNVSGLIEVFHRRSFMTTLNMCYSDPLSVDPSWLCLLFLTFAIGLVMAAPIPGSREFSIIQKLRTESADRAEVFYCDAKSLGDPSAGFEDAGFWSIQALLLMAVYNLAISKRNAAYAYHGMAVRSAFALGLHREETFPIYSSSEQSIRRNLWRSLFVLDRFLATALGRPTSIRESDCSGATLSTGEMQSPPQSPFPGAANSNVANTQSLGLAAAVRSCRVIGVILESVYSSRKISTKLAQEIADSCKSWHRDLDPSLNHRHQSSATPSQGITILHINLLYCHSVILLTRPFFLFVMDKAHKERRRPGRKPLSRLERFAEACVSASSHTIALVQAALDKQYLPHRNPFVLYFLFASALVVIANEFSALFPNPNATNSINNAVGIMHFFAQQDTQGSRLLFILTSFRDVAVREQATRNQQQIMEQQQQPIFQQPLPPMNANDSDPMGNIFCPATNQQQEKPPTPTLPSVDPILHGPLSNPTMSPPSNHISVPPNPAYPPNSNPSTSNTTYASEHTKPCNDSIYSLDNFFDAERPLHTVSNSGSECNDSLGENAEIDFEMLWQWPNSHAPGLTPGAGAAMGMNGEGILGEMNGTGGGLGVHEGNVPLFGMSSADFGVP